MPAYESNLFNPPAPLARVTRRNSSNSRILSDVPMLIDTGADVTLIPESCASPLDLYIDSSIAYELMALDGSTSVAEVVQLDLLFLRRVFRGRFLLSNQEYGVLGRDILNHIMVLLDGPRLAWEEERRPQK
jgi:hypothetical protein